MRFTKSALIAAPPHSTGTSIPVRLACSTNMPICDDVTTSSAESPTASGRTSSILSRNACRGTCLPRSCTAYPLFSNIVFTRFLPMSCTSPYTVPRTSVPFDAAPASSRSRYFSSSDTAAFMHSADFRTNGSMSWPDPNRSPTSFMAGKRSSLSVRMAPSCVFSGGSSSAILAAAGPAASPSPSRRSDDAAPILSAMASTTSSRMPSLSRWTMRKLARLPGGQDGSTSGALGPRAPPGPAPAASK